MQSEAHKRATKKYVKKAYDHILVRVRKDTFPNKSDIEYAALCSGESINGFIFNAIKRRCEE